MKKLICWLLAMGFSFGSLAVWAGRAGWPPGQAWSAGIGIGGVVGPDYRGSKSYRSYVAPVPYLVCRGHCFRADDEGVRGRFRASSTLEVNLSALATLTPDAEKNDLLEGTRPIGSTAETGRKSTRLNTSHV